MLANGECFWSIRPLHYPHNNSPLSASKSASYIGLQGQHRRPPYRDLGSIPQPFIHPDNDKPNSDDEAQVGYCKPFWFKWVERIIEYDIFECALPLDGHCPRYKYMVAQVSHCFVWEDRCYGPASLSYIVRTRMHRCNVDYSLIVAISWYPYYRILHLRKLNFQVTTQL